MPKSIYKDLWETIKNEKQWTGIVKNLRKDRGYYWVKAVISGVYKDGGLVEYKSLRSPISFDEKLKHQKLYDRLREENGEKKRRVVYE